MKVLLYTFKALDRQLEVGYVAANGCIAATAYVAAHEYLSSYTHYVNIYHSKPGER